MIRKDKIFVACARPLCLIGGLAILLPASLIAFVCGFNVVLRTWFVICGREMMDQAPKIFVAGGGLVLAALGIWFAVYLVRMSFGKYEVTQKASEK